MNRVSRKELNNVVHRWAQATDNLYKGLLELKTEERRDLDELLATAGWKLEVFDNTDCLSFVFLGNPETDREGVLLAEDAWPKSGFRLVEVAP